MEAESEGDNHFKAVNIHAAFVRQADGVSYFAFTQNAALIDYFTAARKVGAVIPNSSQSSHSLMAVAFISVGMLILPCSLILMIFFLFSLLFKVIKCYCKCSSPYPPTYATGFPCPDLSSEQLFLRIVAWSLCWCVPTIGSRFQLEHHWTTARSWR